MTAEEIPRFQDSGSKSGLLPVPRRLFRRERDLERYLNLWRLFLIGAVLAWLAARRLMRENGSVPEDVVIPILLAYFLAAAGLQGALVWKGWWGWLPAWVVGADLVFVSTVHFSFVVADLPLVATNSHTAFLGYFVVVALTAVRSDPILTKGVGVGAPVSYAAVVFLAVAWRGADMAPADPVLGSFHWEAQAARGVALAAVTYIVTLDAALRHVDRTAARQDPLTGVFNRRHLEEFLNWQVSRSLRLGRPLAILLLDLDGFKAFNDRHGHLAGDHVLADVAAGLARRLRATDMVARLGGDEFVVVLPDVSGEEARQVAWDLVDVGRHDVRFSVGIACLSQKCRTVAELLNAADGALLRVKRAGGGVGVAGEVA